MFRTITKISSFAVLLAGLSVPALAQASYEQWEGTWETTYGEVRLIENGDYVYGDYGDRGTIQGILSDDKSKLRGVFVRNNGSIGYIDWVQSGDDGNRFFGRWKWSSNGLPQWDSEEGGTKWRGDRRSETTPRLVSFTGTPGRSGFLARQTSAYRSWAQFAPQAQQTATRATRASVPSASASVSEPGKPWLEKIPYFRTLDPKIAPDWFEIKLNRIGMGLDEVRTYEIYGTAGLYAYCETPSGTRALRPYYNNRNRVLDRPRRDAKMGPIKFDRNAAKLRFEFDEDCLKQNGGRLSFQLQTNLAEKDTIRRTDDDFGYRGWKFYFEDLPTLPRRYTFLDGGGGLKIYRSGDFTFRFRHVERLNGRWVGERMYFYGDFEFGWDGNREPNSSLSAGR